MHPLTLRRSDFASSSKEQESLKIHQSIQQRVNLAGLHLLASARACVSLFMLHSHTHTWAHKPSMQHIKHVIRCSTAYSPTLNTVQLLRVLLPLCWNSTSCMLLRLHGTHDGASSKRLDFCATNDEHKTKQRHTSDPDNIEYVRAAGSE